MKSTKVQDTRCKQIRNHKHQGLNPEVQSDKYLYINRFRLRPDGLPVVLEEPQNGKDRNDNHANDAFNANESAGIDRAPKLGEDKGFFSMGKKI